MTAPPQMNGQPPVQGPAPMLGPNPDDVTAALQNAILQTAQKGSGGVSGAEAKDFGQAALNFAQALVVLDPALSQGGTPLAHDVAIEAVRGQTQENVARIQGAHQVATTQLQAEHSLKQAKETAAAPTPAKTRTVSVRRDPHGRAEAYSVNES